LTGPAHFIVRFYVAYRTFFIKAIEERGVSATLDEYIFSEKYNFEEGREASTQPKMLDRFVGGLFHALIHVEHATEFGIPGMVAEGTWRNKHRKWIPDRGL
jgi:hypothetical protein